MASPPRAAVRRPISITIVLVAAPLGVVISVLVIPLLLAIDVATRSSARRARVWCLIVGALGLELVGVVAAVGLTAWHLGRIDQPPAHDRFHRLERWWAARHAANLRRFAGLRWVVENPGEVAVGHAIVLARHASHADAILPVLLFGCLGGHRLRYTLKDDLQWTPALDIVGNRLPNVFVDRSPGPDSLLTDRLEALAAGLEPDGVAVIFPEGTFFTEARLDRAATRLAETRPDLEGAARGLRHLLPPRPAGTLALLRGAPDADVVLVAHQGMEVFSDIASIRRNLPLKEPVRVRMWRIARDDVPVDDDDLVAWLLDRWIDVDRWIDECVVERSRCPHNRSDIAQSALAHAQELRP